jgi:hypothetical protein
MRKTWQTIKEIIHTKKSNNQKTTAFTINGNMTEDANAIASHFNSFFVNIGPILDSKIPKTNINPISYITKKFPSNMFLTPCDPEELGKVIDRLKNCATGSDLIPSILLKNNKHIFNPLLTHINLSLSQGIFPKELKIANIIPIFKLGEVGNYRPISLLTIFSKVFERIFFNRLLHFITKHKDHLPATIWVQGGSLHLSSDVNTHGKYY